MKYMILLLIPLLFLSCSENVVQNQIYKSDEISLILQGSVIPDFYVVEQKQLGYSSNSELVFEVNSEELERLILGENGWRGVSVEEKPICLENEQDSEDCEELVNKYFVEYHGKRETNYARTITDIKQELADYDFSSWIKEGDCYVNPKTVSDTWDAKSLCFSNNVLIEYSIMNWRSEITWRMQN